MCTALRNSATWLASAKLLTKSCLSTLLKVILFVFSVSWIILGSLFTLRKGTQKRNTELLLKCWDGAFFCIKLHMSLYCSSWTNYFKCSVPLMLLCWLLQGDWCLGRGERPTLAQLVLACFTMVCGLPDLGPLRRKYLEKSNISPQSSLKMSLIVKSTCLLTF